MDLIKNLRDQITSKDADAERVANITSLITFGFEVGGDNSGRIAEHFAEIIERTNDFFEPLNFDEICALPDGVCRRLTDARAAAVAYREKIRAQEVVLAPMVGTCKSNCGICGKTCHMCGEPD